MQRFHNQIEELVHQGEFKRALKIIRRLLKTTPDDEDLLIQEANILWNLLRNEDALDVVMHLHRLGCTDLLADFTEGRILTSMNRFRQALAIWEEIGRLSINELTIKSKGRGKKWSNSVVIDSYYFKAICYEGMGMTTQAIEVVKHHLSMRKKGVESDFNKKEVIRKLKNLQYVVKYHIQYTLSNEGYMTHRESLLFQHHIDKLRDESKWMTMLKYLRRKAIMYPQEYYINIKLSDAYYTLNCYNQAVRHSTIAYDKADYDPLAIYNLARDLMAIKDYSKSLHLCNKLLEMDLDYIAFGPNGEGMKWAKSIISDTKLVKSVCLMHCNCWKDARELFNEHKALRRKGISSEFGRSMILDIEQIFNDE